MNRTKLSSIVLVLSLLSIILVGCMGGGRVKEAQAESRYDRLYNDNLEISTDNETGCKYIAYLGYNRGGITPLLKIDGTPDCGE